MATQQTTIAGRVLVAPSVILLFAWMLAPLARTLYFSTAALQPARSDNVAFIGFQNYAISSPIPISSARSATRWSWSPRCCVISVVGGLLVALLIDQPMFGQGVVAADGHRAVLRHADGERARLEEPVDEPEIRALRLGRQVARPAGAGVVHQLADAFGDPHRLLGMAAVRGAHPAHRAAVARRGAEGGRRSSTAPARSPISSTSSCRISRAR